MRNLVKVESRSVSKGSTEKRSKKGKQAKQNLRAQNEAKNYL